MLQFASLRQACTLFSPFTKHMTSSLAYSPRLGPASAYQSPYSASPVYAYKRTSCWPWSHSSFSSVNSLELSSSDLSDLRPLRHFACVLSNSVTSRISENSINRLSSPAPCIRLLEAEPLNDRLRSNSPRSAPRLGPTAPPRRLHSHDLDQSASRPGTRIRSPLGTEDEL